MEVPRQPLTFIVRLTLDDGGVLSGVVERVRTGEKRRFQGAEALGHLIAQMVRQENTGGAPPAPN